MSGRVHARNALVLAAALALAGCVTLLPKADPVTLYRFGAAPVEATAAAEAGVRIGIVRAPTLFQRESAGDQLLTVSGDKVAYMADARWVAPAPVLWDQAVAAAFDGAPSIRLVGRGDPAPATYSLRLEVRSFETRYERGSKAAPVVLVRVRAVLTTARDRTGVVETLIEARAPAAGNRISAIIPAYDKAVGDALGQITGWVADQAKGS